MADVSREIIELEHLIAAGRYKDAVVLGRQITARQPAQQRAWLSLSEASRMLGDYDSAVGSAAQALNLDRTDPYALAQNARCLLPGADFNAILPMLTEGLVHHGDIPWVLETMAACAVGIDHWQYALKFYSRLGGLRPLNPQYQFMLGVCNSVQGCLPEAEEHLLHAVRLAPLHGAAWHALMDVAPDSVDRATIDALCAQADGTPASPWFWQIKGQLSQKEQHYGEAFTCYTNACTAKRKQMNYSVDDEIGLMQGLTAAYKQPAPGSAVIPDAAPTGPVFIVGLPRTGSTLVETFLVNSGALAAAGELRDLEVLLLAAVGKTPMQGLAREDAARIAAANAGSLGADYLRRVRGRSALPGQRIIDKNPFNFRFIGPLLEAMPEARVVHVRKHPLDACLGNFRHLFAAVAKYSYDLEELAAYYIAYDQLMRHWQLLYPDRLLTVDYETLITDPERESQRIYQHCGLIWSEEIISLEGRQGEIRTASANQIRRGLNTQALGRWRHFAEGLEPLRKRLEEAGISGLD
jgi:tetratricopeptide (TPR) repeat protein